MHSMIATAGFGVALTIAALHPANAAGPFDGTYRGPLTVTGAMGRTCSGTPAVNRVVKDSVLSFKWVASQISVPVAADGTISGDRSFGGKGKAHIHLTGKITGDVMTFDTEGTGCGFHYEGHKIR